MANKVFLISPYKGYKMLTNRGKIEFYNGTATVDFANEAEAKQFVKSINDNPALKPYVKVVGEEAKKATEELVAKEQATKVIAGAQTSEMKAPAGASQVSPASLVNLVINKSEAGDVQ